MYRPPLLVVVCHLWYCQFPWSNVDRRPAPSIHPFTHRIVHNIIRASLPQKRGAFYANMATIPNQNVRDAALVLWNHLVHLFDLCCDKQLQFGRCFCLLLLLHHYHCSQNITFLFSNIPKWIVLRCTTWTWLHHRQTPWQSSIPHHGQGRKRNVFANQKKSC